MTPMVNPCTGQMMDSKSQFERTVKQHGCEIIGDEYKNKRFHPRDRTQTAEYKKRRKEAVVEAYRMHKQGYRPPQVSERQWREQFGGVRGRD